MSETILFGPKPSPYFELSQSEKDQWFVNGYDSWRKGLLEHDVEEPAPLCLTVKDLSKKRKIDIKVLLEINLRAATILHTELEKKKIISSKLHNKYFSCIFRVICKFHSQIELTGLSLPEEFDALLKDALQTLGGK